MSNAYWAFSLSCLVSDETFDGAGHTLTPRGAEREQYSRKKVPMFLILAVVLVIAWIGGFVMFKSAGLLIHLLLLFAIISIVMHFVTGRRAT